MRFPSGLARALSLTAVVVALGGVMRTARAQDHDHGQGDMVAANAGGEHDHGHGNHGHVPPGQAKKHVSTDDAVVATREILGKHGYEFVRVEHVKGAEIVYYRAGNHGHGRGHGRLEHMIIRPSGVQVVFEAAPPSVLVDIKVRLGI